MERPRRADRSSDRTMLAHTALRQPVRSAAGRNRASARAEAEVTGSAASSEALQRSAMVRDAPEPAIASDAPEASPARCALTRLYVSGLPLASTIQAGRTTPATCSMAETGVSAPR